MNLRDYLNKKIFHLPKNSHLKNDFNYWYEFLNKEIEFDIQSKLHGVHHCGRVLLYVLILADKLKLSDDFKQILCHTAVFHDSKRFDDSFDIGHGARGAKYYQDYCKNNGLAFYQESYLASFY